jgi:hypothetical protein
MWGANSELRSLAGAAFGALNARDLDGFIAVAAEDVEFTSMVAEMEGTTFRRHDATYGCRRGSSHLTMWRAATLHDGKATWWS